MNKQASSVSLVAALATTLALVGTTAMAAKPVPPPPPDPCVSPGVVTEATFPSFVFKRNITTKNGAYTIGTFLADATGKCEKLISTTPGQSVVNMRYDSSTDSALIVWFGGGSMVGAIEAVTFSATAGPGVTELPAPVTLLSLSQLSIPADLPPSEGWHLRSMSDVFVSPSGTHVLFNVAYNDASIQPKFLFSFWTCDLVSTTPWVDPSSCKEVHRARNQANDWSARAGWGATDATIYVTEPPLTDPMQIWLFRVTLATGLSDAVFNHSTLFRAPQGTPNGAGELVAIFEQGPKTTNCQNVVVIDPSNCPTGIESCVVLNNQGQGNGARSFTWLPDGRVAAGGQTAPDRQGKCLDTGTVVAFPAIDPNGAPVTTLTTGSNPDGAGGG